MAAEAMPAKAMTAIMECILTDGNEACQKPDA